MKNFKIQRMGKINTQVAGTLAPANQTMAVAYRSGHIAFVTPVPGQGLPEGTLFLASGAIDVISNTVKGLARRAYDNETLLVPGVPEAANDDDAFKAHEAFLVHVQQALQRLGCENFTPRTEEKAQ